MAILATVLIVSVPWAALYFWMVMHYSNEYERMRNIFLATHNANVQTFKKATDEMINNFEKALNDRDQQWREQFQQLVGNKTVN
jgi:hypothetical protein